jgi:hypothetical protein
MNRDNLITYLNDHLAGSVLAIEMIESTLEGDEQNRLQALLAPLLTELREDQSALQGIIDGIGKESSAKKISGWLAEKAARIKLSDAGDDLSRLETLELLLLGIRGKLALWTTLQEISQADRRLGAWDYAALQQRARQQMERVEAERIAAARQAFLGGEKKT